MVRAPCCEKMGLKRGPWAPEEDEILVSYIEKNGHGNWRALPKQAGLLRCGKSCRLRWTNYLRPDIKRGNFTQEEEEAIIKLHEMLGNRWSAIAARLPGRTDNEIKNVWHTSIKKKLKNYQPPQASKTQISSVPSSNFKRPKSLEANICPGNGNVGLRGMPVSPDRSSSELSSVTDASARNGNQDVVEIFPDEMNSSEYQPQIDESFWSEQSSSEITSSGKESTYVNPLANYELLVKQEEMDSSKFIRQKECGLRVQVSPPDESIIESDLQGLKTEPVFKFPSSSIMECDNVCSAKAEDDMDFWFNLFIRAEDLPDLPEF
ncbi:hypothetical protein Leryth_003711 [Lithospermum erythrorhizon]|nr:hypothetical protein Leryth_003711 [Lithospermum erythrorhizon]